MTEIGGQNEVEGLRRVFLKHPREAWPHEDVLDIQWRELGYLRKPDLSRATDEHDALVDLLKRLGAQVDLLPRQTSTSMDSMYVRDASIVTDHGVVLCNMGKIARRPEPLAQEEAFLALGFPVLGRIEGEGRMEGGDFIWLDDRTVGVGRGYRTNDEGIRQLRALLPAQISKVVVVPLPHWKGPSDVFHLMSIISPIDRDLALVYSPLLPVPFREFLLSRGTTLVEVPEAEFDTMACNVLAVAPRICLMLDGNPVTRKRLEAAGAEVFSYKGEEISVPGQGGPTCLTRPVLRAP